jgi:hypothetical protein
MACSAVGNTFVFSCRLRYHFSTFMTTRPTAPDQLIWWQTITSSLCCLNFVCDEVTLSGDKLAKWLALVSSVCTGGVLTSSRRTLMCRRDTFSGAATPARCARFSFCFTPFHVVVRFVPRRCPLRSRIGCLQNAFECTQVYR